jgi:hypothetical protein
MNRPQPDEFAEFYKKYIDTVDDDVVSALEIQAHAFPEFIRSIPNEMADHAYAPGKWTVKELIGHVIDTERIMAYRALRFSRNDSTPVAGFEEDQYVRYAHFTEGTIEGFAQEFTLLRRANMHFVRSLTEADISRRGTANNSIVSVRALLFIMAGHVNHHMGILKDRYLTTDQKR